MKSHHKTDVQLLSFSGGLVLFLGSSQCEPLVFTQMQQHHQHNYYVFQWSTFGKQRAHKVQMLCRGSGSSKFNQKEIIYANPHLWVSVWRILFWTDWDATFPRIEAASMCGGDRHVVFKNMEIGAWPNGLTLDHLEKRIVWTDARWERSLSLNILVWIWS